MADKRKLSIVQTNVINIGRLSPLYLRHKQRNPLQSYPQKDITNRKLRTFEPQFTHVWTTKTVVKHQNGSKSP